MKNCLLCSKEIVKARITRLYCNSTCRKNAFRERNKPSKGLSVANNALSVAQKRVSVADITVTYEEDELIRNPFTGVLVHKDILDS